MHPDLANLVAATPELAAMPATSARLLELLDDPDVPVGDLVGVIEKDPGLTANVLKLSNSAYYGVRREVGSVRDALTFLGNRTVVTLAFAASMGRLLQAPVTAYRLSRGELWRHSLAVGLLAARLAPGDLDPAARNRVFTAGVVHDIGKLLLDRTLLDKLEQLPPACDANGLILAERQRLGFDHAQAGAAIAEAWNFPGDLVAAIAGHQDPAAAGRVETLVCAGDLVASRHGVHGGAAEVDDDHLARVFEAAGLDPDAAEAVAGEALRDLDGLLSLLGENA